MSFCVVDLASVRELAKVENYSALSRNYGCLPVQAAWKRIDYPREPVPRLHIFGGNGWSATYFGRHFYADLAETLVASSLQDWCGVFLRCVSGTGKSFFEYLWSGAPWKRLDVIAIERRAVVRRCMS